MVGSDIDIDDVLRPRRMREATVPPEKSPAELAREERRAEQDRAVGAAIGKTWPPHG